MALQNLLCELYVHNLVVPDNKDQNSLFYVGDVQFRAIMSWMQNEISRESQAAPYREKEMLEPLYIHVEVQNTHRVFFDQLSINNNPSSAAKIHPVLEQAFLDWKEHCSTISPEAIGASTQRWIRLSEELRTRELHSPQNLELANYKMPRYVEMTRDKKSYWVPLFFQPPILLHPMVGKIESFVKYNLNHEELKWERLKQNHGYFNYRAHESGENIPSDLRMQMRIKKL